MFIENVKIKPALTGRILIEFIFVIIGKSGMT
jgi:hypothetical protein